MQLRYALGMYEEFNLDCIKANHRGSLLILNVIHDAVTTVGGFEDSINIARIYVPKHWLTETKGRGVYTPVVYVTFL
jgi:hypothetical protein